MDVLNSLESIKQFVASRQPPGTIIDTGVLLPYVMGFYDPKEIERVGFSKSGNVKFSELDFDLIKSILSFFKTAYITPHILAEFSNISRTDLKGEKRRLFFEATIDTLSKKKETAFSLDSLLGVKVSLLAEFGITDISLLEIARQTKAAILTIDSRFAPYAETQVPVILYQRVQAHQCLIE